MTDHDNITNTQVTLQVHPSAESTFGKLPHEYYVFAVQWVGYDTWTIEEAANLLVGCLPHRPLLIRGSKHRKIDDEVIAMEDRIRSALDTDLELVKKARYFGKTFLKHGNLLPWAERSGISVPGDLKRAYQAWRSRSAETGYTTPCLEAIGWTIAEFWEHRAPGTVPTPAKIIRALRKQFPDLDDFEIEIVERVTRHPDTYFRHLSS